MASLHDDAQKKVIEPIGVLPESSQSRLLHLESFNQSFPNSESAQHYSIKIDDPESEPASSPNLLVDVRCGLPVQTGNLLVRGRSASPQRKDLKGRRAFLFSEEMAQSMPNLTHSRSAYNRETGCTMDETVSGKNSYQAFHRGDEFDQLFKDLGMGMD